MFPHIPRRPVVPLLTAVLLAACAAPPVQTFRPPSQRTRVTRVAIKNGHWERLDIYLERDGTLFRLGEVEGMTEAVLRVPDEYLGSHVPVRLVATEVGRIPHVVSTYFELGRGHRAEWTTGPMDHPTPVSVIQVPGG